MIMGGRPAVRLNKATGSGRWGGLGPGVRAECAHSRLPNDGSRLPGL